MKKLLTLLTAAALLFGLASPALALDAASSPISGPTEGGMAQREIDTQISALGGTPGKINVRLNDKCVAFPDAFPEIVDGSTLIPVRAVVEALGAAVEQPDAKTVSITLDNTVILLSLGEKAVTVTRDGKKEELSLPVAPFIQADRTYVPLRFISEVFGYDVFWDNTYRSVVILDGERLIAEMDKDLSSLNALFSSQSKYLEGNWKTTGTMDMKLELIDAVNGNKSYTVPGSMISHMGGGAAKLEAKMDLAKLLPLFTDLAKSQNLTPAQLAEGMQALAPVLKSQSITLLMQDDGKMYLQMPLMSTLMGADENTWYAYSDLGNSPFDPQNYSMGGIFYPSALAQLEYMGAFNAYELLAASTQSMSALFGDKTFTKSGDTYTWIFDKAKLLALFAEDQDIQKTVSDALSAFELKLSFNGKTGSYDMSCKLALNAAEIGSDFSLTGESKGDGTNMSDQLSIQMKDLFNFKLSSKASTTKTDSAPVVKLPEGATVVDLFELIGMSVATGVGALENAGN